MDRNNQTVLQLIRASVWGADAHICITEDIYEEMKKQALIPLPANILSSLDISDDLFAEWKKAILQQIIHSMQCKHVQANLPLSIPYTILKGTSASQYYPHPDLRTMGDIDIITKRDDYQEACNMLLHGGFRETPSHADNGVDRHRTFSKNGVTVENHFYFAMLNDPQKAEYLDSLITNNINESHTLPDLINGLVLLEHVNQHMEDGIGLRQIIDWMMFVDKCLPDEKWPQFYKMALNTGLDKLAIVTTRMCEIYLGLPEREWCADANEVFCEQLMDYILSCGNFGNKRTSDEDISENVFAYARTLKSAYILLQTQGLNNWRAAKKHKALRTFAWLYQLFRYISRGIKRNQATTKIKNEYRAGKKRAALFEALGVKTTAKGLVVYKNGKYVKE